MQGLVNALSDPVATAHPYPLTRARRGLFDDRPSMNVNVRWRGDPAPIDGIRFGGLKNQGSGEAGNGYAAKQETAHLSDPSETPLPMLGEVGGKAKAPKFQLDVYLALSMTPPRFHVRMT